MRVPVSRQTLEGTPSRAFTFLRAIGTSDEIRAGLEAAGYTPEDHDEGWLLLMKESGYGRQKVETAASADDAVARNAIKELDGWDEKGFRRARAALARLHPAQNAFVFEGLAPSKGMKAVVGVATFLDRLDALEGGKERSATRQADRAALKTLALRGITKKERARLRQLVDDAVAARRPARSKSKAPTRDKHPEALHELRRWYEDWSETARSVVSRRDFLIRLGLAKRKKRMVTKGQSS